MIGGPSQGRKRLEALHVLRRAVQQHYCVAAVPL